MNKIYYKYNKFRKLFFYKNIKKHFIKKFNNNKNVYIKNISKKFFCKKIIFVKHIQNNKICKKVNLYNEELNNNEDNEKLEPIENICVKFCVFAGRYKNMCILHIYVDLLLKKNIINEYHIFDFSRLIDDHLFLKKEFDIFSNKYPYRVFLHNYEENDSVFKNNKNKNNNKVNWTPFYKYIYETSSEKDVIIKCDDDILFIDILSLENAIQDRINDKLSFLIHSNCINNGVCTYYQKDLYPKLKNNITYPIGGILGILFEKPEFAYVIHHQFAHDIDTCINNLNKYIIKDIYINTRISINFILLNGIDAQYLKDMSLNISKEDEYELSSFIPELLCRPNKIKGDLITSHLSYSLQEKIILSNDVILNLYKKLSIKYLEYICNLGNNVILKYNERLSENIIKKCIISNNMFRVKNWINENSYYIKNVETNKYLYIDYDDEKLSLSDKKTIFNVIYKNNNHVEIKLGIYYLTRYNISANFKNETILLKNLKELESNKDILLEYCNDINDYVYIKFPKYNMYLGIINLNKEPSLDINLKKEYTWIFEKAICKEEFINVHRYIKNNKFYYVDTNNDIYTNFYKGWGYENIIEKKLID